DRHSGQVSFPGGRYEPEDKSLASGAIREAQEEVGINPSDIQLLGRLTELYIPVSNFLVHPFVGFVNHRPSFIPQESEVAEILEVPLSHLLDPMNTRTTKIHLPQNVILSDVPYYHVAQKVVWGATAMMLSEFLEVVEAARPN
ncbi:MAG: CoA pyrophosphatase, partial [Bacteroidota bacterium]